MLHVASCSLPIIIFKLSVYIGQNHLLHVLTGPFEPNEMLFGQVCCNLTPKPKFV